MQALESIPEDLRRLNRWVMWRYEKRGNGKPTKPPYTIHGHKASTTTDSELASFDDAAQALQGGKFNGIGVVFPDGSVGIDLDNCLAEDKTMKDWAKKIVSAFSTYTEISPSGTGVKMWVYADFGDRKGKNVPFKDGSIEIYSRPRYFTVTGNRFNGCESAIASRQNEVDKLYAWLVERDKANRKGKEWEKQFSFLQSVQKPESDRMSPFDRCRLYLEKCPESIEGQNGSGACFHAACVCFRFGLSESETHSMLSWYSAAKSSPPWSEREIAHKINDAFKDVRGKGEFGVMLRDKAAMAPRMLQVRVQPPPHTSGALSDKLAQIKSGGLLDADWPYCQSLTKFARPLTVQSTLVICGAGGSTKSLWLSEACIGWLESGVEFSVFHLEEDREFHLMRALAQLAGNSNLTDPKWIKGNPDAADDAYESHMGTLDALGKRIWDAPEANVSLNDLETWIHDRAKEGSRVIAVDPVTAADSGREPWIADRNFILNTKRIMREYKSSLVLVTHPRQGNVKGENRLDNLAGGKAYNRFTQCVLWMESQKDSHEVVRSHSFGSILRTQETVNRRVHIIKSRNGPGSGAEIGYYFDSKTLRFRECGIILGKDEQ